MLVEGGTFGPYEVRRRLAVGGMGEVYLCRHRVLDRFDAVKVLRPHLAGNADFRRRFLREALSAARLRHPNVVTLYTADERDGLLYLAMEYVPGEDLAAVLARDGPLDPHRTARLLRTVADALDAAHRAQLVHRDVKPSNLLITAAGAVGESVTLVDFGVSRVLDADAEITRTGEIIGTIAYCAPEQLARAAAADASCDQYALACVGYECLTGQVPYPRESQLAIMTAHLTAEPPRASALRPLLPAAVDRVLARAMAKTPAARFPTCVAFADAFAAALDSHCGGDHPALPGPGGLMTMIQSRGPALLRVPHDADFGALRLGWAAAAPVAVVREPLLVRAEPAAAAGVVRWLVAQAAARQRARHLCLVCALPPAPDEGWMWVNWLPHARPGNPPLTGPHYATSPDVAAELLAKLRAILQDRRCGAAALDGASRVLAILDVRLGADPADPAFAGAAGLGVDIALVAPPGSAVPPGFAALDVTPAGATFTGSGSGAGPIGFVPDSVDSRYVRELADLLPEQ